MSIFWPGYLRFLLSLLLKSMLSRFISISGSPPPPIIVVLDKEDDSNIVLARNKSPLLIGIGTDEFLAASDPLAIGQLTNEFIFLEDGDVAQISAEDFVIYDSEIGRASCRERV